MTIRACRCCKKVSIARISFKSMRHNIPSILLLDGSSAIAKLAKEVASINRRLRLRLEGLGG